MKKSLVFALLVCCSTPGVPALADVVYCTNCSDKVTQALDRVTNLEQLQTLIKGYDEAIQQTAAQLEMVQQNIQQYANMVQNTVRLPREVIRRISDNLSEAGRITAALNSMRADIQGLARIHEELYGTRDDLKNLANLPRNLLTQGVSAYHTSWDTWSDRVDRATQATFQLSGHQLKQLEESGELESYVNSLLDTPEGQQQALMAANQLAALQIQEARQLRELIATKVQSDLASQTKREKEGQMAEEIKRTMTKDLDNIDTSSHPDPF
ncbi:P-type conjugative transfer protein TrbJ [uncultured Desulfovibrio sp.]|uniref:P-type conjugative transfer protein TrbJ n=1 Tax=uncultured Desulfovibrio sp. TaxID=167968 RepID=UPI00260C5D16|nr:P-type conjugative transfer protein TrbJ [uncultured Desulfovibrio sp.]